MNETEKYIHTWNRYKRNDQLTKWLMIIFLPILYLVIRPLYLEYGSDFLLYGFIGVWILILFILYRDNETVICPRCGKFFHKKLDAENVMYRSVLFLLTRRPQPKQIDRDHCLHCGLKRYSLLNENNSADR